MTNEKLILKMKEIKSVEELIVLAKENDLELSEADAKLYLDINHNGELSDDSLSNVSGGGAYTLRDGYLIVTNFHECDRWKCDQCGGDKIEYMRVASDSGWAWAHKCGGYPNGCGKGCATCKYMKYRFPFQICTHPETRK